MRSYVLLVLLALLAFAPFACSQSPPTETAPASSGQRLGAFAPGNSRFFYATGTAGTVTVAAGSFVTGISAHATGGGATLTITPSGPDVTDAAVGSAIPIPAGGAFTLGRPILVGQANELGTGSVLVFVGTDAYFVSFFQGGGP